MDFKDTLTKRSIHVGNYIVQKRATIRQTAKALSIHRSTVYRDIYFRLPIIDKNFSTK